ncbi:hypothetical protein [Burkholderia glumae]|uniref:hypothetical protein n=1 Tax=Burkholderia glumae TaxID=337 RepID=UPI000312A9EC|nr:hypothetical protein [Burkholderia glumae]
MCITWKRRCDQRRGEGKRQRHAGAARPGRAFHAAGPTARRLSGAVRGRIKLAHPLTDSGCPRCDTLSDDIVV